MTGILLMSVFLLAATPRQFLHDLVTSHSHVLPQGHEEAEVSIKGYQCDTQSAVAKSPFVEPETNPVSTTIASIQVRLRSHLPQYSSLPAARQHFLRGPPVQS